MASTVVSATRKKAKRQSTVSPTEIVAEYAAAKSRRDIDGALRVCREDFLLDTVPFGIRGKGKTEVAAQLRVFFTTFPDYAATLEGQAASEEVVTAWGTIRATMRGSLGSFAPTGRAFALPFFTTSPRKAAGRPRRSTPSGPGGRHGRRSRRSRRGARRTRRASTRTPGVSTARRSRHR